MTQVYAHCPTSETVCIRQSADRERRLGGRCRGRRRGCRGGGGLGLCGLGGRRGRGRRKLHGTGGPAPGEHVRSTRIPQCGLRRACVACHGVVQSAAAARVGHADVGPGLEQRGDPGVSACGGCSRVRVVKLGCIVEGREAGPGHRVGMRAGRKQRADARGTLLRCG